MPCTGCTDINNNLYKNHRYYDINFKCFKPIDSNINKSILESAINGTLTNVSQYFKSCDTTFDNMINVLVNYFYIPFSSILNDIRTDKIYTYQSIGSPIPSIDNTTSGLRNNKPSFRLGSSVGNGGYLTYSSSLFKINANEPFTIQFYVKSYGGFWGSVFSINTYLDGILCRLLGSADSFYVNGSFTDIRSYFAVNQWRFVNIVRDLQQQKIKFHVDGNLVTSLNIPNTSIINSTGGNLLIGASGIILMKE